MFFATPHKGGNLVALGKFVAAIVRHTTPGNARNDLLFSLEKGGFFTEELSEDWRQQLEDYVFVSFYETRHTKILGKDVGLVGSNVSRDILSALIDITMYCTDR